MDISITLPSELVDLIETKVRSGRYGSSSEVVQEALYMLALNDGEDVGELRQAWQEGIDSGDAGPLDFVELRKEAMRELEALRRG